MESLDTACRAVYTSRVRRLQKGEGATQVAARTTTEMVMSPIRPILAVLMPDTRDTHAQAFVRVRVARFASVARRRPPSGGRMR